LNAQQFQKNINFSIAANVASPAVQQFAAVYNEGLGASFCLKYPFKNKQKLTFETGFITFSGKSDSLSKLLQASNGNGLAALAINYLRNDPNTNIIIAQPSLTIFPIKIGYQYYWHKWLYAALQAGYTFGVVNNSPNKDVSGFCYTVGFGIDNKKLDIGIRYENFRTPSPKSIVPFAAFVSLHAAFKLDL
jgi:hypothetical protein